MQTFNLDISYAIVSAIRAGINYNIPEEEKINYDVDTAEDIYKQTNGYSIEETISFIENSIKLFNKPVLH